MSKVLRVILQYVNWCSFLIAKTMIWWSWSLDVSRISLTESVEEPVYLLPVLLIGELSYHFTGINDPDISLDLFATEATTSTANSLRTEVAPVPQVQKITLLHSWLAILLLWVWTLSGLGGMIKGMLLIWPRVGLKLRMLPIKWKHIFFQIEMLMKTSETVVEKVIICVGTNDIRYCKESGVNHPNVPSFH